MTEVPKIVHQRLRAAAQAAEGAHPEADVLAAFAEQALSALERESVIEHLAACGDCREVVVMSLPATEFTAAPVEPEFEVERVPVSIAARRSWFAWGNLRWAALAAGIAVAVLVAMPGLERWAKSHPPASTAAKQTTAEAVPTAPTTQFSSGSAAELGGQVEGREVLTKQKSLAPESKAGRLPAPLPRREVGTLIANNIRRNPAAADKSTPEPPAAALAFEPQSGTNETVEVSGATAAAATESSLDNSVMARDTMPAIEKAKPALDEMAAGEAKKKVVADSQAQMQSQAGAMFATRPAASLVMSLKPNVMWMIKAGVLQRSLDGGQSWQTAVKADHALLCYANRGQEIWAGGEAGALMRSTDGGATWSPVKVSSNGQSLSSDVTRIDLREPAEIVLAIATHETWTSTDGGKTWEKK